MSPPRNTIGAPSFRRCPSAADSPYRLFQRLVRAQCLAAINLSQALEPWILRRPPMPGSPVAPGPRAPVFGSGPVHPISASARLYDLMISRVSRLETGLEWLLARRHAQMQDSVSAIPDRTTVLSRCPS